MDAVITYVNNEDITWLNEFNKYNKNKKDNSNANDNSRYRSWDNLKYCLRGIDKYMPFIRKIHIIVSGPTQIPTWLNTNNVNIVYHKDIIPAEFLPTFNSRTIEMFMHNIKDLDEEFIYFNDDMFIIKPTSPENFFINGKPCIILHSYSDEGLKIWGKEPVYYEPHRRCTEEVKKILNINNETYCMTNHGPCPLLKSVNKELFNLLKDKIYSSITRFRDEKNYIHFIYSIYLSLNNLTSKEGGGLDCKYFASTRIKSIKELKNKLINCNTKVICINDIKDDKSNYVYNFMNEANNILNTYYLQEASQYETYS